MRSRRPRPSGRPAKRRDYAIDRRRFRVIDGRSAVLIEARSNVGPIAFGTTSVAGEVEIALNNHTIDLADARPTATLTVELATLRSGNTLYDAELLHRIDARVHPVTRLDLRSAVHIGETGRYQIDGDLAFHGVTRSISGSVAAEIDGDGVLHVAGEHIFDIRDFGVIAPSVLMLRIYPDVRVELELEAGPTN